MGSRQSVRSNRPDLNGPHVTLRGFRSSDALERRKIGCDPEIWLMYGLPDNSDSSGPRSARAWYGNERNHPCSWAIEYRQQLIGSTRLNLSLDDRRARFAIGMYSSESTGRGLGTEATELVLILLR